MRQIRIFLGIIIVVVSLTLLAWGFLPSRHEIRTQPIPPAELQLPAPATFHIHSLS